MNCASARGQRGLTLLELLVTLVIAAAAVTILGQAVWQVYRIESLLADERVRGQTALLRTEWVRHALAGLRAGDSGDAGRLRGGERELSGMTSNPIGTSMTGFGPLALRLRFNPASGDTVLEHVTSERSLGPTFQPLLQWAGDRGRFVYLRTDGSQERQWPPALGQQPPLPVAIFLETGLPGHRVLVAVPLAVDRVQPTRRELERL